MSLPHDVLSDPWIRDPYVGAGKFALYDRSVDCEDGPVAEQDPSQGMFYQRWTAYVEDEKTVWLEAEEVPKRMLYQGLGEVTDISFAFNQNGDVHYVYVEDGVTTFHWYNTLSGQFEDWVLPPGTRTPKLTVDEKRESQRGISDIILSYIKADHGLYFRMQRDRFQVEYQLHPGPFIMLRQVYMSRGWRLQWLVTPGLPIL